MPRPPQRRSRASQVVLALVLVVGSFVTYFVAREENPVTGERQAVAMTVDQEVTLGLQAAPEMAAMHGGLDPDRTAAARVARIGEALAAREIVRRAPYTFEFHLLADPATVNAFALPGGQIFLTRALYDRLADDDAEIAGVLAHEIGHVLERHAAQRLAKARLAEGLTGAAAIATYDPENPGSSGAAAAALVAQVVQLRYGRDDELESDAWGVRLLADSGLDPHALIAVMEVLAEAGGGRGPPEFFSTHPNPENRIERIRAEIERLGR